ncbi:MAG TPA: hypothetical protein VGF76_13085 [Polyangiaceae bacterium]|jgi:hypothetical protein
MEAKPPTHAREMGAAPGPAQTSLELVSGSTPEPASAAELAAAVPSPHSLAEPDRILAIFDWLCAGPVSKWERELTRHAHWRLA